MFRYRRGDYEWAVAGMGTPEEAALYADGFRANNPGGWSRQASIGELAIFIRKVRYGSNGSGAGRAEDPVPAAAMME
jgi:hypothetical protein